MSLEAITGSELFTWVIIPILIFLARVTDVTIGTIRVIFIARGFKLIAPFLGFFEVLVWLLAIQRVLSNLTNVACYLAYGFGFAAGTFVGIYLEERISIGKELIQIIANKNADKLIGGLRREKYSVTSLNAKGTKGNVKVISTIIKRQEADKIIKLIKKFEPQAFYSMEDIRLVSDDGLRSKKKFFRSLSFFQRKGK